MQEGGHHSSPEDSSLDSFCSVATKEHLKHPAGQQIPLAYPYPTILQTLFTY